MFLRYAPVFIFCLCFHNSVVNAQSITGVWEGIMDDEFIQINIRQKGNQLCGYTYDYVLNDRTSYCIARFEGNYNAKNKRWYITGSSFIANSGSHILMKIVMWYDPMKSKRTLKAVLVMRGGLNIPMSEPFELNKISNSPYKMPKWADVSPCFPEPKTKPATPVLPDKKTAPRNNTVKPQNKKPPAPPPAPRKPDSMEEKKLPPPQPAPPEKKEAAPVAPSIITQKMGERIQTEQSRVVIHSNHLNLKLFDNGTVDGDTVSVFYNGKLLVSHQGLSEKPINLDIDLDSTVSIHKITLYAENLGSIPPNTAMIIVTAGNKRFELRSKASLEENAVLVFEYQPEDENKLND